MEANAKELALPDDDPDALLILLNIAHLNFDILTGPQCFAGLLKLALLCDKYDTAKLIRPWLGCWLETAPVEYRAPGHEEWLFIAWTFGKELVYNTLSKHLVSSISIDESGRYLNSKGTLLGESFPPGALGSLNRF